MFGAINTDNSQQVGGNLEVFQQDASGFLKVNLAAALALLGTVQVADGTTPTQKLAIDASGRLTLIPTQQVTANAGTNLNTSALALESGGNLAAILADTADIETNTANIPPPGQALASASTPVVLPASQIGGSGLALENGGNLASAKNDLDTLAAAISGMLYQANIAKINGATPNLAQETGGNLATLVTDFAELLLDTDNLANAATAANQTTGNTSLSSIATNTGNIPSKGTNTMANSEPVTIATDDTQMTAIKNSVAAIPAKGAATTANSTPVNIASDQIVNVKSNANGGQIGTTSFHLISAATTNSNNIKASSGQVYGYEVSNSGVGFAFVKLYNKATAPSIGTDTPIRTIGLPPSASARFHSSVGIKCSAGIGVGITGLAADSDTTAVLLSQVTVDVDYA